MVTIRLFGLLRESGGERQLTVEADTVREALKRANEMGVDKQLLRDALIFINNKPLTGARRYARRLSDGDELALLSPAAGG